MVTRLADDPLAEALALAEIIAKRSPDAVRGAKQLLNHAWECDSREGLALEAELQMRILGQPNQMEAVRAGMAGATPNFSAAKT